MIGNKVRIIGWEKCEMGVIWELIEIGWMGMYRVGEKIVKFRE